MKAILHHLTPVVLGYFALTHCASASSGRIFTGADTNSSGGHVKAFTPQTHSTTASFFAYPAFQGGVRVAAGDVNGDGAADLITGSGPGAAHVKVFSGRDNSELRSFLPYGSGFNGGVFVAAGDVNGDGFDDIITGTDTGAGPHVKVFSGTSGQELRSFFAYGVSFSGGVRVAAGDLNGDGVDDIITGAGPGGGPHVKVFDGSTQAELRSFFAFDPSFQGGVFVAAGDITGTGRTDLVISTDSGALPQVKVLNGSTLAESKSFLAYSTQFSGGVRVAVGDLDGDGRNEIVTSPGNGAGPLVRVFDGIAGSETGSFFAYPESFTGGVFIGVATVKRPVLEIRKSRVPDDVQLLWPSGCVCELEGNVDPADPTGWEKLDVTPEENGNRLELFLPAAKDRQFFRLNCDTEAVR